MKKLIALLIGGVLSVPALANTFYGQIDAGIAQYEDVDDVSATFGARVGAQLFDTGNFQGYIESGYKDLGNMETDNLSEKIDIQSYSMGLKLSMLDIKNVELYGFVGAHYWESENDDDTDPYLGISIETPLSENIGLGVGYNYFRIDSDAISQLELKVLYHF